jgi:phosphoserine / homoserine phosphotransferase
MYVICSDLEGVFIPEVWINVAKITGIDELKLTTRDINDYDVLMKRRLAILEQHNLTLKDIQKVISQIEPLEGALDFINWIKENWQFFVVSDTFIEFADPLMQKLQRPTLLCNHLTVDNNGKITDYNLRQKDQKRMVVKALHDLNYKVIAFGDSYNDISMLLEADKGILFKPPVNVINDYPDLPVVNNYEELRKILENYIVR